MKIRGIVLSLSFLMLMVTACQEDKELTEQAYMDDLLTDVLVAAADGESLDYYIMPDSDDYSAIPQDPNNVITKDKVILGQMLFHESAFGVDARNPLMNQTFSCASCHHVQGGFQAGMVQGIGDGGMGFGFRGESRVQNPLCTEDELDVQPIRTPSALNVAYQKNMLWNGQFGATGVNAGTDYLWTADTPIATNELGYEGVETQAIAGLKVHRMNFNKELVAEYPEYLALFDSVFADFPESERYSRETAGLAIAAYERTLLANEAPFQKWLKGDSDALTHNQKRGAVLFFGNAGCESCHTGPGLSSMEFHALGMGDLSDHSDVFKITEDQTENLGRGGFTKDPADNFKFKVPQLYNLKDSPFYGHGASFTSVYDVVAYKNLAKAENSNVPSQQLDPQFSPLQLAGEEVEAITDFIENALYDDQLSRYAPMTLPSGHCFPNNDEASVVDLGCQ